MARQPRKPPGNATGRRARGDSVEPVGVRIIGGQFRGRKLLYSGDFRTRPMKDRVREALFNRLGHTPTGKLAIDLFAGTGALGLEAISRGAVRALFIEQHVPTARAIRASAATFGAEDLIEVVSADTFFWYRRHPELPTIPWLVFCSPPYDFYVDRADDMLEMLGGLITAAPVDSAFVVESDERFDPGRLPQAEQWDTRAYPPAVVAIYWKQ